MILVVDGFERDNKSRAISFFGDFFARVRSDKSENARRADELEKSAFFHAHESAYRNAACALGRFNRDSETELGNFDLGVEVKGIMRYNIDMSRKMSFLGRIFYIDDVVKNRRCNMLDYPRVTVEEDLDYVGEGNEFNKLDVYYDKRFADKKYPVLFNVHGGGWIVGDKKFRRGYALQMADDGLFVVNPNYALAPEYTFPTCIRDLAGALRWVCDHAEEYNLDLNNVFVSGDSAGSHLASLLATATVSDELGAALGLKELPIKFRGALLYCGVYDFDEPILHIPVADVMLKQMFGCKRLKDVNQMPYYRYLNPLNYMTSDFPETMVVSGKLDFFTSAQHPKMLDRLNELGVSAKHYHATALSNSFHCFFLKPWMGEARKCLAESKEFIRATME